METKEALLKLMCLPTSRFDGVCRTSDGNYLDQAKGDLGYNVFLGNPSPPHDGPGRRFMFDTWDSLSREERKAVLHLANNPMDGSPIRLKEDFGVPTEEV